MGTCHPCVAFALRQGRVGRGVGEGEGFGLRYLGRASDLKSSGKQVTLAFAARIAIKMLN